LIEAIFFQPELKNREAEPERERGKSKIDVDFIIQSLSRFIGILTRPHGQLTARVASNVLSVVIIDDI